MSTSTITPTLVEDIADALRAGSPGAHVMVERREHLCATVSTSDPRGDMSDRLVGVFLVSPTMFGIEASLCVAGAELPDGIPHDTRMTFTGALPHEAVVWAVMAWGLLVQRLEFAEQQLVDAARAATS